MSKELAGRITALLIEHELIPRVAIEDADGYDRGAVKRNVARFAEALRSLEAPPSATRDTNEPADALEMAREFLREIVQRQPEVLKNHDVEAFILNVLNPALVASRKVHRHILSMQRIVDREAAAPATAERKAEPVAWISYDVVKGQS